MKIAVEMVLNGQLTVRSKVRIASDITLGKRFDSSGQRRAGQTSLPKRFYSTR